MKIQKLRELTPDELQHKHDELWSELFGMRIKHSLGQLENPLLIRGARRDIARVKTLLAQHGITEIPRRRKNIRPAAPAAKPKAAKPKATAKPKETAKPKAAAKAKAAAKPKAKAKTTKSAKSGADK